MRTRQLTVMATLVAATWTVTRTAVALEFFPITSVASSTAADDFFPVENLIEGSGVGFDAAAPHNRLSGLTWVTAAPGGFPSDYIEVAGMPILTVDLGANVNLTAISTWGYADSNANGVSQFSLRFATSAEGIGGFGTSIDFNPTFNMTLPTAPIQTNVFSEAVSARYVEFTVRDNFFVAPGTGAGGEIPGGDRAGLGEIAFPKNLIALVGDVNGDGLVNINDYTIIRDNFYVGTTPEQGDLDLNGLVTEADFRIWKDAFGGGAPSNVPEPATWVLAIVGLAAAQLMRRRSA